MSTRSKAQEDVLMKQLNEILENQKSQLTKEHFDTEINSIKNTLKEHDEEITSIKARLDIVENQTSCNSDDVYKELYEQERRKKNIIIFKMPEQGMDTTLQNKQALYKMEKERLNELFSDMELIDQDDELKFRFYRLGKNPNAENPRPLKVEFKHSGIIDEIFGAAKNLKGLTKWNKVSIAPDKTKKQQELGKATREKLLQEATTKNNNRSPADVDNGVEYKVLGNYSFGNLRVQRTKPSKD